MPGTFCSPLVFDRLRLLLGNRFDVRALSWMTGAEAFGIDDVATWVGASIGSAGHGPVLLVGHSTGGAIALRLALTRPDLVAGLMLINTGPHMHQHGDVSVLIETMQREGTAEVLRAVLERSFHRPPSAEEHRRLLEYGESIPLRAALDVLRSQHVADFTPDLSRLTMPVCVVHGRHDRVRTVDAAEAMAAAVPDCRLWFVDAGHSPMYEAPSTVAEALVELEQRVCATQALS